MGVSDGSILQEEEQETPADKRTMSRSLTMSSRRRCREAVEATLSTLQQIKQKLSASTAGLTHYLSLLCFLLVMVALLQTLCLVQISALFQSQAALQDAKLTDVTEKLERLNQSYQLLFSQYPALNQYCSARNATTGERVCSSCPAGWTPQGQKCFLFSPDRADWISSQYRCMALGGAVATVRTEEEQVFLWRTAHSLSQGDSYWLGLRSGGGADGGWQWSDGSPLGQGPGFWEREPDQTDSRELCGRLTPGGDYRRSWFTYRCSNLLRRICERRKASLQ